MVTKTVTESARIGGWFTLQKFTIMTDKYSLAWVKSQPVGRHRIENGLYLSITGNGSRYWAFRYTFNGKRRFMTLANANHVSYSQAVKRLTQAKNQLYNGIDPLEERKKNNLKEEEPNEAKTFSTVYMEAINHIASVKLWRNRKHSQQWVNTIESYALPILGHRNIEELTKTDIASVLLPIWKSKSETASRLRGRLELIFNYLIMRGYYSKPNPALWRGNLEFLLPPIGKVQKVSHHASMPYTELKRKIDLLFPPRGTGYALILFTILGACRIGETAPALWSEIDFDKKILNIPPERRKDGRNEIHRVPLTSTMIGILDWLKERNRFKSKYVFFSSDGRGHISRETPRVLIQRIFRTNATMHGMRSTFRDWCAENGIADILAEKSLMHATGSQVVQAYQRSDLLESRREIMQRWDDFLLEGKK